MQSVKNVAMTPSTLLFVLIAVTLTWMGIDHGGYFPPAWGWATLALAWATTVAFVLRGDVEITRADMAFIGGLGAFAVWNAASLAWTPDRTVGVENVERDIVYLSAALAAVALRDRTSVTVVRNAVLAGALVVCGYSLGTRLFPDWLGVYTDAIAPGRLFNPLGYWNAQGTLAALAMLLAASVAVDRGRTVVRALAAALVPMLALDCYFTLSRGSILALAVGLAFWLVLEPRRLRVSCWFAALAIWPLALIWHARHITVLTGDRFGINSAAAGHRLAGVTLIMSALTAAVAVVAIHLERNRTITPLLRRALLVGWVAIGVIAIGASIARYGTPAHIVHNGYSALTARPTGNGDGPNVSPDRVLSLSLSGRNYLWTVSWNAAKAHPLTGGGVGSYEQRWLLDRTLPADSRWAHSLYLETLGETGLIGLVLLIIALTAPVVAGVRNRAAPLVPALTGAYVAYLFHAGVDWDWQVPALTLAAVWCGSGVIASETGARLHELSIAWRGLATATAVGLAVIAAVTLAGNRDLALSHTAATKGDYAAAARSASAAASWQPWSYLPWQALGQVRQAQGDRAAAVQAYLIATRRDPGRWDTWLELAGVSRGHAQQSALRTAYRLNPLSRETFTFCHQTAETASDGTLSACVDICSRNGLTPQLAGLCRRVLGVSERRKS